MTLEALDNLVKIGTVYLLQFDGHLINILSPEFPRSIKGKFAPRALFFVLYKSGGYDPTIP